MTLTGHLKRVVTAAGETHEAPAVILATGSAYKELGPPEEKKFSGHGLSWCATCDGFLFRDQDIIVVGGGDSAMEEATFLTRFGKTVTLVVRKDEPRTELLHGQVKLDAEGYIKVDSPTTVTNLSGVFACGDAVDHRYRQAITAAGTGCAAALVEEPTPA